MAIVHSQLVLDDVHSSGLRGDPACGRPSVMEAETYAIGARRTEDVVNDRYYGAQDCASINGAVADIVNEASDRPAVLRAEQCQISIEGVIGTLILLRQIFRREIAAGFDTGAQPADESPVIGELEGTLIRKVGGPFR